MAGGGRRHVNRRVLYIQYANPAVFPPLEHSSREFADHGWTVLFLGVQGQGGAERLRFRSHARIKTCNLPFCPAGWLQKIHYSVYAIWALAVALMWRPGWIYASDVFVCPVGLLLSLLPGVNLLYHEHDWPGGMPRTRFARICLYARAQVARRSRLCVLPNQERVNAFVAETDRSGAALCVRNFPALSEVAHPRATDGQEFKVYYHGSLVPERLPVTVVQAMTRLPDFVTLTIVGYETVGAPGYVGQLKRAARQAGLADRVHFVGAIPCRQDLLDHAAQHHIGLSLMPMVSDDLSMREMVGASNKPLDYIACGLALMVSELPRWVEEYVATGLGIACDPDDPDSISAAIGWCLNHPVERQAMVVRGQQRILKEWHYEREFAPVRRLMEGGTS